MSSDITIRPVATAFVDFAWEVYSNDPCWVPPHKTQGNKLPKGKQA